jgi:hypothetical protein
MQKFNWVQEYEREEMKEISLENFGDALFRSPQLQRAFRME